ncbi:hypothetical protein RZA67_06850 [Stenotrophomonas sp. C3(2023)]|uniref:hypothetical protein n=1 Tax=Stenotrophomonas sp. C3(2023) TaxID=3080277 RepID=UPI00293C82F6|nr:hypothetical protein [Stenotrophomonas sp. C3(2023)]MDV3468451.1 hypothetical protein [Stenotrophomonas sp. C3(2023)]
MKIAFRSPLICLSALALAGCASHAPDFSGRWKPLNRLPSSTTSIPLHQDYVYQVSPMDGTLKSLLERWARDTGLSLDYGLDRDYSLVSALTGINTTARAAALDELGRVYEAHGVRITTEGQHLRVRSATQTAAP